MLAAFQNHWITQAPENRIRLHPSRYTSTCQQKLTSYSTLASEIGRHSDREGGIVGRNGVRDRCVVGEVDQLARDHGISCGINDRDVGCSSVWCTDSDGHRDNLTRSVGLDVRRVVGELVALAKPNIALCCLVVRLGLGNLKNTLNISQAVGGLIVVHF
jgi:hypothetical protein